MSTINDLSSADSLVDDDQLPMWSSQNSATRKVSIATLKAEVLADIGAVPGAVISVAGKDGVVLLDKADVGLSYVDNTSDLNKPVSTAQAAADTATLNAAKSYADSLGGGGAGVDDAIVDGVTTRAPSQNAVFDALALKTAASALAASTGTTLVGWLRGITGAVATTLAKWIGWQAVTPLEFMSDAMRTDAQSGAPALDHAAALQAAFDSGKIVLIDEVYLTSGNQVPSGAHIIFRGKGELKLTNGANRPLLQNTNWQKTGWGANTYGLDKDITIEGLNIDGNQANQAHTGTGTYLGEYTSGVRFFGVTNLKLIKSRISMARTFGVWMCAIDRLIVDDMYFDQYMVGTPDNQDGLHINGPARYLTIRNVKGTTNDDMIALNADDGALGSNVTSGAITDAIIDGVQAASCLNGIRLLSATSRMDKISVRNVSGITRDVAVNQSPFGLGNGNVGTLTIENIDVTHGTGYAGGDYFSTITLDGIIENVTIRNVRRHNAADARPSILLTTSSNIGQCSIDGLFAFDTVGAPASQVLVRCNGLIDTLSVRGVNWFRDGLLTQSGYVLLSAGTSSTKGITNLLCGDWVVNRISRPINLISGQLKTAFLSNIYDKDGASGIATFQAESSDAAATTVYLSNVVTGAGRTVTASGGSSTLTVVSNGGGTTLQSGCEVRNSASQGIPSNVFTKVVFNTVTFDRLTEFSTANSRFTAQAAGTYEFNYELQVTVPTNPTSITPTVYKNGALFRYLPGANTYIADTIIGGMTILTLSAGDYVELFYHSGNSTTITSNTAGTLLHIERIK